MTNKKFVPEQTIVLRSDELVKAYVHPTRMTILPMLAKEQRTISSVAKQLGVHPANITHHFKLMEKVGLIKLVEKRDNGRNIEKYYRAAAYHYEVNVADETSANKQALALSILRDNLSIAINNLKQSEEKDIIGLLATARIKPKDVADFKTRLMTLIEEFSAADNKKGETYTLNMSLYPNDSFVGDKKTILID